MINNRVMVLCCCNVDFTEIHVLALGLSIQLLGSNCMTFCEKVYKPV